MPPIAVFICPSDGDVTSQPDLLGLSYSANSGGWDRGPDGSFRDVKAGTGETVDNGVFFDVAEFTRKSLKAPVMRMSAIKDGAGTTLMLAENIHKTYFDPDNAPLFTWLTGNRTATGHRVGRAPIGHGAGAGRQHLQSRADQRR